MFKQQSANARLTRVLNGQQVSEQVHHEQTQVRPGSFTIQATAQAQATTTAQHVRQSGGKLAARTERVQSLLSKMSGRGLRQAVNNAATNRPRSPNQMNAGFGSQTVKHRKNPQLQAILSSPRASQPGQPLQQNSGIPSESQPYTRGLPLPGHEQTSLSNITVYEQPANDPQIPLTRCSPGRHRTGTIPIKKVDLPHSHLQLPEEDSELLKMTQLSLRSLYRDNKTPNLTIKGLPLQEHEEQKEIITPGLRPSDINDDIDNLAVSPDPVSIGKVESKASFFSRQNHQNSDDLEADQSGLGNSLASSSVRIDSLATGELHMNTLGGKQLSQVSMGKLTKKRSQPPRPAPGNQYASVTSCEGIALQQIPPRLDVNTISIEAPGTSTSQNSEVQMPLLAQTRNFPAEQDDKTINVKLYPQAKLQFHPPQSVNQQYLGSFERAIKYQNSAPRLDGTSEGQSGRPAEVLSAGDKGQSTTNRGPDHFFMSVGSGSAGRITEKDSSCRSPVFNSSQVRISEMQELQANLREDQPCTIKQGEQSFVIDAALIRKLRQLSMVQNEEEKSSADASSYVDQKSVAEIDERPLVPIAENVDESDAQRDSATPRIEHDPDLMSSLQPEQLIPGNMIRKPSEFSAQSKNMSFMDIREDTAGSITQVEAAKIQSEESAEQYDFEDETPQHDPIIVPLNQRHDIIVVSSKEEIKIAPALSRKITKTKSMRNCVRFDSDLTKVKAVASNYCKSNLHKKKPSITITSPMAVTQENDDQDSLAFSTNTVPKANQSNELTVQGMINQQDQLSCIQRETMSASHIDEQKIVDVLENSPAQAAAQPNPEEAPGVATAQADESMDSYEKLIAEMNAQIDNEVQPPPPPKAEIIAAPLITKTEEVKLQVQGPFEPSKQILAALQKKRSSGKLQRNSSVTVEEQVDEELANAKSKANAYKINSVLSLSFTTPEGAATKKSTPSAPTEKQLPPSHSFDTVSNPSYITTSAMFKQQSANARLTRVLNGQQVSEQVHHEQTQVRPGSFTIQATAQAQATTTAQHVRQSGGKLAARTERVQSLLSKMSGRGLRQAVNNAATNRPRSPNQMNAGFGSQTVKHRKNPQLQAILSSPRASQPGQPLQQNSGIPSESQPYTRGLPLPGHEQTSLSNITVYEQPANDPQIPLTRCSPGRHRTGTIPIKKVDLPHSHLQLPEEDSELLKMTQLSLRSLYRDNKTPNLTIKGLPLQEHEEQKEIITPGLRPSDINDDIDNLAVSPDPVSIGKVESKASFFSRQNHQNSDDLEADQSGLGNSLASSSVRIDSLATGELHMNTLGGKQLSQVSMGKLTKKRSQPPRPAPGNQYASVTSCEGIALQQIPPRLDVNTISIEAPGTSTSQNSEVQMPLLAQTRNFPAEQDDKTINVKLYPQAKLQFHPPQSVNQQYLGSFERAIKYQNSAPRLDGTSEGQSGRPAEVLSAGDKGQSTTNRGPDHFFMSVGSGSAGRITEKDSSCRSPVFNSSQVRISEMQELQANLREDQPCTIKQGEQSFVIDAALIRKLRQLSMVQNEEEKSSADASSYVDQKSVAEIDERPLVPIAENVDESDAQRDSATPRIEHDPDLMSSLQPEQLIPGNMIRKPSEFSAQSKNMSFMDIREDTAGSITQVEAAKIQSEESAEQYDFEDETPQHDPIIVPLNQRHDIIVVSSKEEIKIAPALSRKITKTKSMRNCVRFDSDLTKVKAVASNYCKSNLHKKKPSITITSPMAVTQENDDQDSLAFSTNTVPKANQSNELTVQGMINQQDQLSCIQRETMSASHIDEQKIVDVLENSPAQAAAQPNPEEAPGVATAQADESMDSYEKLIAEMNAQIDNEVQPPPPPKAEIIAAPLITKTEEVKLQVQGPFEPSKQILAALQKKRSSGKLQRNSSVTVEEQVDEELANAKSKANAYKINSVLSLSFTTPEGAATKKSTPSAPTEKQLQQVSAPQSTGSFENEAQLAGVTVFTPRSHRYAHDSYDRRLQPINEEISYEQADLQEACLDESMTASNVTSAYLIAKPGLLGKPSDFNSGDLRQRNLRLNHLNPFVAQSGYGDRPPTDSGDPLIDQIGMYAYGLGVDPLLFSQKDDDQANEHMQKLMRELLPRQRLKRGKSNLQQAQKSIHDSMTREMRDIRSLLHSPHIGMMPEEAFTPTQMPGRRLSGGRGLPRHSQNPSVQDGILKMLREETVKNKSYLTVLTIALNRYLNNQDRQKVNQINRQIRILEQHERKVQEIVDMFKTFKKELHFAFLFASPLVVQKQDHSYKFFPQLNFTKEFVKIRDSINAAQVQINITKRQCTTDSLQEVLAQKPLGLHFSGHGLENNEKMGLDFYEKNKGQGDFLVLENEKGGSELVSREQLKKMIRQNKCELEFVFVATCHSEEVGTIFQQAGAKHVICIKKQNEVKDDAAIAFTNTFYNLLFQQNKEICTAFYQAQLSVEISMGQEEANIFKLLLREDLADENGVRSSTSGGKQQLLNFGDNLDKTMISGGPLRTTTGKLHYCKPFGPFQKGRYNYVNHQIVYLQNKAPKMPKLRGRQKDMFRLMDKTLNSKNQRLFNLIGWPGTGKSALVASMLDYIAERCLLKGGSIYFNARNITMCEVFIRNFNQVLISENPTLFGIAREQDQAKHEPIKTLESILAKISIIDGDIVLVIDNAEGLIINERNDFAMLVSMMLTRVSQLKILLTSQRPLQTTLEFKEDRIILSNLSNIQSANLFKEVMGRDLEQVEINALLRTKPDFTRYPDEQHKWEYKQLHEHHLFTLLNGIPQSIILVASVLADLQKKLTLKHIYKMLTDDQCSQLLEDENIKDSEKVSLRLSAQISFQTIEDDPECVDLLYLLSLLPGGISPEDLDYLWLKTTQIRKSHIDNNKQHSDQSILGSQRSKFGSSSGKHLKRQQTQSAWRRALAELQKMNLAVECKATRRAHNVHTDEANTKKAATELSESMIQNDQHEAEDIVIILPEIVRNFSEVKINDDAVLLQILSSWYEKQLHEIYVRNENIVLTAHRVNKQSDLVGREFERLEENLNLYVLRMHETKLEERHTGYGIRRDKRKQMLLEETSDSESLSSEDECTSLAEDLFSKSSSNVKLPATGSYDTFRQMQAAAMKPPARLDNQIKSPSTSQDSNIQSNYPELREAYLNVNKQRPALERYIEAMKPVHVQHPRDIQDREERALAFWRWAFEKVKSQEKDQKMLQFQNANVNSIAGESLEESFDSIQSDEKSEKIARIEQEEKKTHLMRIGTRRKLMEQLAKPQQSMIQMNFQRGSIKDRRRENSNAFTRQVSRMSVVELRRNTMLITSKGHELTVEERTMIYHLVNLVLLKQFNVANSLIKRHLIHMKKCGSLFRANMRRLQALSLFRMYEVESQKKVKNSPTLNELYSRLQKLKRCLKRAEKNFGRSKKSAWGLGLTFYQRAIILVFIGCQVGSLARKNEQQASPLLRKNLPRSKSEETRTLTKYELLTQAKNQFEQAAAQFTKVNHWRGLHNVYRNLDLLADMHLDTQLSNASNRSPRARPSEERRVHLELYKKYLDYYEVQRYSQSINTDLTIQRTGGDDLSLMSEVVISSKHTQLFEAPEKFVPQDSDSFQTDTIEDEDLTSVCEGDSEYESYQNIAQPEIQVVDTTAKDHSETYSSYENIRIGMPHQDDDSARSNQHLLQQHKLKRSSRNIQIGVLKSSSDSIDTAGAVTQKNAEKEDFSTPQSNYLTPGNLTSTAATRPLTQNFGVDRRGNVLIKKKSDSPQQLN